MLIAAQLRPWIQSLGPDLFREKLPAILATVADIGYAGFETALPLVLSLDSQDVPAGLSIAAAHHGARWWDITDTEIDTLLADLDSLASRGAHRLAISIGSDITALSPDDLSRTGETLGTIADRAPVEIAIHNHSWEISDDCRILRALFDAAGGSRLRLGADLGWVVHAGTDPITFIRTFADVLTYTHVRDYDDGFIEIGRGAIEWPALIATLRDIGYTGWLTAESEFSDHWRGERDPETTVRLQAQGIAQLLNT